MSSINVREFVDLKQYPVDSPDSPEYARLVSDAHAEMADDGCAVLAGFVRFDCVTALVDESDRVAETGHRSFNRTNVYSTQDDPKLPDSHPLRRFYDRSNSFVPADNFGEDSILRNVYEWPRFAAFIQAALNEKHFFRYADPLADVIVNMVEEGNGFPWHFDTNNYTVTLAIQNGVKGGEFEYCPNLRSPTDESYAGVEEVLAGKRGPVKTLNFRPGDLQIFKGRYSLHRVNPVVGMLKRYAAIISFVEEAGMVGSPERTRQLYGRVLPIHLQRAGQRLDTLMD